MLNTKLSQFIKEAKRELKYTCGHRQGIILGYHKINLDALLKEGAICESERKDACFELDIFYSRLIK